MFVQSRRVVSILVWWLLGLLSLFVSMESRFQWSLANYAVSELPVLFYGVLAQWGLELIVKEVESISEYLL